VRIDLSEQHHIVGKAWDAMRSKYLSFCLAKKERLICLYAEMSQIRSLFNDL
jgi:hypothetical protein